MNPWNLFDVGPPAMLLITMYYEVFHMDLIKEYINKVAIVEATMSLFIWLKFLYFLRIF